ncbi:hypothetical protein HZB94_00945 [Candidatus Falkowbacteria bacterium]|nr:hypothetical protein [Candidatus Falkowbacteria bacterium]
MKKPKGRKTAESANEALSRMLADDPAARASLKRALRQVKEGRLFPVDKSQEKQHKEFVRSVKADPAFQARLKRSLKDMEVGRMISADELWKMLKSKTTSKKRTKVFSVAKFSDTDFQVKLKEILCVG